MQRLAAVLFAAAASVGAGIAPYAARAQGTGERPIRIVVGFPAGAGADTIGRVVAERMAASLGQPVIVENRTGAAGRISAEVVKNAAPDGLTLLFAPVATVVIFPITYKNLSYDPFRDFEPLAQLGVFQIGLAVGPGVQARTLPAYVSAVKADRNLANYSSAALGSLPHFFVVMFARTAGLDLVHVPYKGAAEVRTALLGGQIPMASIPVSDLTELHRAGKLRVLATSGATRSATLPDVPTLKEQGYDIEGNGWYGLFAPSRTPRAQLDRLSQAAVAAVKQPDVRERLLKLGLEPTGIGPAELAAIMKADLARWTPVIRSSGFTPDD